MPKPRSKKMGRYLYAIVDGSEERTYGAFGVDGGIVYSITDSRVSAVVGDVPNEKMRPERRHLAAHQEVLKRLMEESTPLPMTFGTIADGPKAILRILSLNREAFSRGLHRVAGKVEMGLRATWDVPNIFEYFVNTHLELRAARDRFFGTQREPTQEDKIELGRKFGLVLNEDRENYTEMVEERLSRYCYEIKRNKCHNEREVMNLACLVGQKAQEQFEAGIFDAARMFDNNFAFDYNGPWAPHNFVDIDLKLET
jgi:hypothetical protein